MVEEKNLFSKLHKLIKTFNLLTNDFILLLEV